MTPKQKMEKIDDVIFFLHKEGIITFNQRRSCDKKMYKIINKNGIKYHKKIRELKYD